MTSTTNYFPDGLPFELTLEITKASQAADLQTLSITTKTMETFLLPVLKKWASEPDIIEDGAAPKLHHAAERANRWLLTKLTDNGASIHIRNPNGAMETALHRAVMSGNHDVVVFLLMHGAEVSMQDSYGSTALHTAVQFMSSNEVLVTELLNQAQDLSLKDDINGWTVIHHAIQGGNTDLVELLLARGIAQLEVADNHHRTPLLLAVQNSEVEIARLLLEAGANIDAMTGGDEVRVHKAIWWAEYERCNEMVTLLKEYEITVD